MTVSIGTLEGTITLKDQFTSVLGSVVGKMSAAGEQISSLGRGLTSFGTILTASVTVPLTAAASASVALAAEFESSFTGVMKTVEDSGDQFGELAQILRDMAAGDDPIPINVNELNAIAEAAGQLGIETAHIANFTRVMADMGVTTNLSSTTAASSLARLANITGMAQSQFSNLGSTIVDLGNNFATTEHEIVDMSLRVAGAGTTIGFTEGQILAVATAMSSLGIRSEQGGSAFSRVLNDMALSVNVGGDAVALFASVAGMSIDDFVAKFQTDAAGAVEAFIVGLGRMQESGGPLLQTLEELGFGGIRVRDVLTRLAGGSDLLVEALDRQETAWSENTALTKEAELRYGTFHSQLTVFWNRLKDIGITIGQAIIPILTSMMDAITPVLGVVARMAEGFRDLWTPLQVIILGLGAFAAAIGPVMVFLGQLIFAAGQLAIAWSVLGSSTLVATLIPAIKSFLAVLFGPVGLITAGVVLLATWKPVREFLVGLATGAFELVKASIGLIVDKVRVWWESTEAIRAKLADFGNMLSKVVIVLFEDLVRWLKIVWERFVIWIGIIADNIKMLDELWGVTDALLGVINRFVDDFKLAFDILKLFVGIIVDAVVKTAEWVANLEFMQVAIRFWSSALDSVVAKFKELANRLRLATNETRFATAAMEGFATASQVGAVALDAMDKAGAKVVAELTALESAAQAAAFAKREAAAAAEKLRLETLELRLEIGRLKTEIFGAKLEIQALDSSIDLLLPSMEDLDAAAKSAGEGLDDATVSAGLFELGLKVIKEQAEETKKRIAELAEKIKGPLSEAIVNLILELENAGKEASKFLEGVLNLAGGLDEASRVLGIMGGSLDRIFGEGTAAQIQNIVDIGSSAVSSFTAFASGDIWNPYC